MQEQNGEFAENIIQNWRNRLQSSEKHAKIENIERIGVLSFGIHFYERSRSMESISGILQQQQVETALKTQMSVLRKSMDVQRNIGELLVGLIEGAASQTVEAPAKSPGLGENLDVFV